MNTRSGAGVRRQNASDGPPRRRQQGHRVVRARPVNPAMAQRIPCSAWIVPSEGARDVDVEVAVTVEHPGPSGGNRCSAIDRPRALGGRVRAAPASGERCRAVTPTQGGRVPDPIPTFAGRDAGDTGCDRPLCRPRRVWHVPVPDHFRGMQPDELPAASAAFTCRSALGDDRWNAQEDGKIQRPCQYRRLPGRT